LGLSSVPATNAAKGSSGERAGGNGDGSSSPQYHTVEDYHQVVHRKRNRGVAATGGSTNSVLHLLAIANEANIPLSIDDFDRISFARAHPGRPQTGGRFVATDLYAAEALL